MRRIHLLTACLLVFALPGWADDFTNGDFEAGTTAGWTTIGQTGAYTDALTDPDVDSTGGKVGVIDGTYSGMAAFDSSSTATFGTAVSTSSPTFASWLTTASGGSASVTSFNSLVRTGGAGLAVPGETGALLVSGFRQHFTHTEGVADTLTIKYRWFSDDLAGGSDVGADGDKTGVIGTTPKTYFFVLLLDDLDDLFEKAAYTSTGKILKGGGDFISRSTTVGTWGEFDIRSATGSGVTIDASIPADTHDGEFTFFIGMAVEPGTTDDTVFFFEAEPSSAVPEPGSFLMLGAASAMAYFRRKRGQVNESEGEPDPADV